MKTFKQLREEIQLDEYSSNLYDIGNALERKEKKIKSGKISKDRTAGHGFTPAQSGQPNRAERWDGKAVGGVSTKKRTQYDEAVEEMLEYIENLETQLDEISQQAKSRYLDAARKQRNDLYAKQGVDLRNTSVIDYAAKKAKANMSPEDTKTLEKRSSGIYKASTPFATRMRTKKEIEKHKNMSQSDKDEIERKARGYKPGVYQGD